VPATGGREITERKEGGEEVCGRCGWLEEDKQERTIELKESTQVDVLTDECLGRVFVKLGKEKEYHVEAQV